MPTSQMTLIRDLEWLGIEELAGRVAARIDEREDLPATSTSVRPRSNCSMVTTSEASPW